MKIKFLALLVLALAWSGCKGSGAHTDQVWGEVLWSGCWSTRSLPAQPRTCVVRSDTPLVLWAPVPPGQAQLLVDGHPVASLRESPVLGGTRLEVVVKADAARVELRDDGRLWNLRIERGLPCERLTHVMALYGRDEVPTSHLRKLLPEAQESCLQTGHQADHVQLRILELFLGLNDTKRALQLAQDLEAAALADLPHDLEMNARAVIGQTLAYAGELQLAMQQFQRVLILAQQIGSVSDRADDFAIYGDVLGRVGDLQGALAVYHRALCLDPSGGLLEAEESARLVQQNISDTVWFVQELIELGIEPQIPSCQEGALPEGLPSLRQPVAVYEWLLPQLPVDSVQEHNARIGLALAYLQTGHPERAEQALAPALSPGRRALDPYNLAWLKLLQGRALLARGLSGAALKPLGEALELAHQAQVPDTVLRVYRHLALAYAAAAQPSEALATVNRGIAYATELWRRAPNELQGGEFSRVLEPLYRLAIDLNLANEDAQGAMEHLRSLRREQLVQSRFVMDQGDALRRLLQRKVELRRKEALLAEDAMPAFRAQQEALDAEIEAATHRLRGASAIPSYATQPRPGQLWLSWHLGDDGWWALTRSTRGTVATPLNRPGDHRLPQDPEALAQLLLDPIQGEIELAEELLLMPYGALRDLPLQSLPVSWAQGQALVLFRPCSFWLDLPTQPEPLPGGLDLLAADAPVEPGFEVLPGLAELAQEMDAQGVHSLACPQATRSQLLQALAQPGVLLFDGHSQALELVGSSRLLLCDAEVGLLDLLGHATRRQTIVLNSCESARSKSGVAERLGLAQALLLSGAEEVIASRALIDNRRGLAFTRAYTRNVLAGLRGAKAWHRTLHALTAQDPSWPVDQYRRLSR